MWGGRKRGGFGKDKQNHCTKQQSITLVYSLLIGLALRSGTSLHHVVELEELFLVVKRKAQRGGRDNEVFKSGCEHHLQH